MVSTATVSVRDGARRGETAPRPDTDGKQLRPFFFGQLLARFQQLPFVAHRLERITGVG
jgi:hypothetical protein